MKYKIALTIILLLAAVLRLYQLNNFPAGLNADEAALGYNAYSLLLTGRDEHGHPWPINFESFGDFKPALYGYILIPFIKVLGLNVWAVRLPSAFAGILSVALIYLLCQELFDKKIALISALSLAISPWHLQFSRGGWEVNVASTFILAGVWLFFRWKKTNQVWLLIISITFLILSMYTYQSARILAPILGLGFLIMFPRRFLDNKRQSVLAFVVGAILLVPLIYTFVFGGGASRFNGVGLLADQGPINRVNELRGQHHNSNSLAVKFLHNKLLGYSWEFLQNYASHFSGDFLFINGDAIQRNKVPETGLLYWSDALLLVIGLVQLIKQTKGNQRIVWWWLLIAPVAAGLTFQTPHALRAQELVFPLVLIISVGVGVLMEKFDKKIILTILVILYGWQMSRYLHEYYVHYPQTYPVAWEYGFDQVVAYVEANQDRYQQVLVTNLYDQPYILFLFYSHYPPVKFQFHHQLTVRDQFNFSTVEKYDKYVFQDTTWSKVSDIHPSLIVAAAGDIPTVGVNIVKTIYFPNGQPEFKIISN